MRVTLLVFGKLRAPGLREATDYYLRNLRPWAETQEIELKPSPAPDKSESTRLRIQGEEAERILETLSKRCSPRARLYLLDERGKALSTKAWAESARTWENDSVPEVVLGIGSSLGFAPELQKKAAGLFSLGPQTLSHEIARLVLAEQLYRAWSVLRGHPYHVEG
jgi:23S rRNA (pseudouridine1915-N3)-methyltransferase